MQVMNQITAPDKKCSTYQTIKAKAEGTTTKHRSLKCILHVFQDLSSCYQGTSVLQTKHKLVKLDAITIHKLK